MDLNLRERLTLMLMLKLMSIPRPSQRLILELKLTLELTQKLRLTLRLMSTPRLRLIPVLLLSQVPRLKVFGTGSLGAAHVLEQRQSC